MAPRVLSPLSRLSIEFNLFCPSWTRQKEGNKNNLLKSRVNPKLLTAQANALSEKMVMAKHSDLTRDPDMIEELLRILKEHLIEAHVEQE